MKLQDKIRHTQHSHYIQHCTSACHLCMLTHNFHYKYW